MAGHRGQLEQLELQTTQQLSEAGVLLSARRREAAGQLQAAVHKGLASLAMGASRFEARISWRPAAAQVHLASSHWHACCWVSRLLLQGRSVHFPLQAAGLPQVLAVQPQHVLHHNKSGQAS